MDPRQSSPDHTDLFLAEVEAIISSAPTAATATAAPSSSSRWPPPVPDSQMQAWQRWRRREAEFYAQRNEDIELIRMAWEVASEAHTTALRNCVSFSAEANREIATAAYAAHTFLLLMFSREIEERMGNSTAMARTIRASTRWSEAPPLQPAQRMATPPLQPAGTPRPGDLDTPLQPAESQESAARPRRERSRSRSLH